MSARDDYPALSTLADSSKPLMAPLVTIWAAQAALDEIDRLRQAVACLDDAGRSLRTGNIDGVVRAVFIWSQRRRRILAGEETWADQRPIHWRRLEDLATQTPKETT